jgi:hypothetical protein
MQRTTSPDTSVSVAVVEKVSAAEGRDPTSLPLLRDAIDPEALDRLCRRGGSATVSFEYSDSRVTISGGESITVEPLAGVSRTR